jgi:trimethylamine--corrinoid protein Co-methyltransferase
LDGGLASSLTQLAIDDEIVQFMRRVGARFDVDAERIGIDAVDQAGPNGGFMASEHTYKHFRDEIRFYPKLLDFSSYSVWSQDPQGIYARAQKRVADILKRHKVPPLEDAVIRELEKILEAADRELL